MTNSTALLWALVILVLAALAGPAPSMRVDRQYERGAHFRFGRFRGTRERLLRRETEAPDAAGVVPDRRAGRTLKARG
jgi:hypothetical protein